MESMSGTFSKLENIHIEHFTAVAVWQCRQLIGGREIAAVVLSGAVHTDIVHQQGNAIVSVESGFPFSSHPLPNAWIDTRVEFPCYGSRFGSREQIAHRIINIDIEMFTLGDTGGCYFCLRDVNKKSFDVSDLNRRGRCCSGTSSGEMLMQGVVGAGAGVPHSHESADAKLLVRKKVRVIDIKSRMRCISILLSLTF